jgi:hypothetical protein
MFVPSFGFSTSIRDFDLLSLLKVPAVVVGFVTGLGGSRLLFDFGVLDEGLVSLEYVTDAASIVGGAKLEVAGGIVPEKDGYVELAQLGVGFVATCKIQTC